MTGEDSWNSNGTKMETAATMLEPQKFFEEEDDDDDDGEENGEESGDSWSKH